MGVCCIVYDIDGMLFEFFMNFLSFLRVSCYLQKNIEKCPFTYWLNGRLFLQIVRGTVGIYIHYILYSRVLILYLKLGGGGGVCNVFLTFYAISNISRKKIWEYKTIISHLMFSSCAFCMMEIL